MDKEEIIIVDDKDKVFGYKQRDALDAADIYRVSALWIENSKGEILLAQRSFDKDKHPGKWGPAVSGTVARGETYESNVKKESKEEIGLDLETVIFREIIYRRRKGSQHFSKWFSAIVDRPAGEFVIQEDEVKQVKWFNRDKIISLLDTEPEVFIPSMPEIIRNTER